MYTCIEFRKERVRGVLDRQETTLATAIIESTRYVSRSVVIRKIRILQLGFSD